MDQKEGTIDLTRTRLSCHAFRVTNYDYNYLL